LAPEIRPEEDVHLRSSALRLLLGEGVIYHRDRLCDIINADDDSPRRSVLLDSGTILPGPFDAMLVFVGRSPVASLGSLSLDRAGIQWSDRGVVVISNTLQSMSQPHIYAVGDCADAIPQRSRCGAQASWTGFHAVRNAVVPRLLRLGSRRSSIHPSVPRVALGAKNAVLWRENGNGDETSTMGVAGNVQLLSFLDLHTNATLHREAEELAGARRGPRNEFQAYRGWIQSKPSFELC
jgi:Pyridine nucleotide-disulphide oxidoreductase